MGQDPATGVPRVFCLRVGTVTETAVKSLAFQEKPSILKPAASFPSLDGVSDPGRNPFVPEREMSARTPAIAVLALLAAASAANAQFGPNLLNNPGFEAPLGFDFSNLTNWNGFFGGPGGTFLEAFNTTGATPRSGSAALVTTIRGVPDVTDGLGAFTGHVQSVFTITAGATYEYSVWARGNPTLNNGAEFRVEWYGPGGAGLGQLNVPIQGGLTSSYQLFSLTDTAPAGAVEARLVLAVQSFVGGSPADTSVAWDDASFRTIPAPGAAALLGVGGLLAARRRR